MDGSPVSATLIAADGSRKPVAIEKSGTWTVLDASAVADAATTAGLATVIEVKFDHPPKIDRTLGIHPNTTTRLFCELGTATKAKKSRISWMEKFGEWKFAVQVADWQPGGTAVWEVEVARPGDSQVSLHYKGEGRPVWAVGTPEGAKIQNQQAASPIYQTHPIGVIRFNQAGRHRVELSLVEGDPAKSSLQAIDFTPVRSSRDGRPGR